MELSNDAIIKKYSISFHTCSIITFIKSNFEHMAEFQ